MNKKILNDKWIKASILGTIWAALEIVLGSFLHNLRIPFSGNILTGIALMLLIAVSYKWKQNGIIWRAGVICALMKAMSPSAVIFGPMIGITMEAIILDFMIRVFGRNSLGYLLGSALAMAWIFVQVIGNFIIYFGFNVVLIYQKLVGFAQRQIHGSFDNMWMPLLLLLGLYALFGVLSGILGMYAGRRLVSNAYKRTIFNPVFSEFQFMKLAVKDFNYSVFWLILNIVFMIGSLIVKMYIPFNIWIILVLSIAVIWAIRYRNAIRQLAKPKFWIGFIVITMLTSWGFAKFDLAGHLSPDDGIRIGLEMNLRAVIIVMGFAVLGTELYNPLIRSYLRGSRFKQLSTALELSLESLPSIISYIPSLKQIVKDPVIILQFILFKSEQRINELMPKIEEEPEVYILTGKIDEGKTTFVEKVIRYLQGNDIKLGGFISVKVMKGEDVTGYDVLSLSDNVRLPFLRVTSDLKKTKRIGKYHIIKEGLDLGVQSILDISKDANVIVIDEVGRLELSNEGWSESMDVLMNNTKAKIIIVAREDFIDAIKHKWNLKNAKVFNINDYKIEEIGDLI